MTKDRNSTVHMDEKSEPLGSGDHLDALYSPRSDVIATCDCFIINPHQLEFRRAGDQMRGIRNSAFTIPLSFLMCVLSHASIAQPIPRNAHANPYGSGWTCDRGFSNNNGQCVAVQIEVVRFV